MKVAIRADFPGGNVLVKKNEGSTVHLGPDLRGDRPWFYWHFEAEATQPGNVKFFFANPPMIGVRGPAVSRDGGKSWQWLGADRVQFAPPGKDKSKERHESFSFDFSDAGQKVRFAVAIPYVQRDLNEFLAGHADNRHLARSVLTKTRVGRRPVDLIQIGKPAPGVRAVLLTARHHACESMASYVLEGFLREAMAESPAGVEFRKHYVVYAVPLVDTDGVETGDQGKNRLPHDHNRDYGNAPFYPEIKEIQELAEAKNIQFSLDLHCPFLRGDIHEAFYFVGLALPHIKDNLAQWSAWINEERPPVAMTPLNLLTDPAKPNAVDRRINSHYFGTRERTVFAVCLEVPYTQANCPLDAALAREYGVSLLRAWVRTRFVGANEETGRGGEDHAGLAKIRKSFVDTYRSKPKEAEKLALAHLEDAKVALPVHRVEANNLMALLRYTQRRYAEALTFSNAVSKDAHATSHQRAAAILMRTRIICGDPKSSTREVEASLAEALRFPYSALPNQAKALEAAGDFFERQKDYERSLHYAREQLGVAAAYEKGRLLNRMAALYERLKRPEDAIACRKEGVTFLRARLGPVPERSIFGALMTVDLFEALMGIPSATLEEKRAAAELVLSHEVTSVEVKAKVRKALTEIEER